MYSVSSQNCTCITDTLKKFNDYETYNMRVDVILFSIASKDKLMKQLGLLSPPLETRCYFLTLTMNHQKACLRSYRQAQLAILLYLLKTKNKYSITLGSERRRVLCIYFGQTPVNTVYKTYTSGIVVISDMRGQICYQLSL